MTPETSCLLTKQLSLLLPDIDVVSWVEQTGSTNDDLIQAIRANPQYTYLKGADFQSAGKGRGGKQFSTLQKKRALLVSYAHAVSLPLHQISSLSICIGISCVQSLRSLLPPEQAHKLTLKWPNDILWEEKKLAGLLIESVRLPKYSQGQLGIVIGLGLNLCGGTELTQSLQRPIAAWDETSDNSAPSQIVQALVADWQALLTSLNRERLGNYLAKFEQYDSLYQKEVNVYDQQQLLYSGTAHGIDDMGRLIIQTADKAMHALTVGDVSIKF